MYLPPRNDDQEWVGVVIAIPEPWVTELTEARLAFGDVAAQKVPAHITLVPPTPVKRADRELLFTQLQCVASRRGPFQVTVRGTNTFLPVSPVAFLEVTTGREDCVALADELAVDSLKHESRFPYHPHVTLAHGLDPETLRAAEQEWQSFNASWVVPGFRLDSVDATGAYTSLAIFDFTL